MGSPGTGVGWGLLDYKTEKYVMTRNWRVGALQRLLQLGQRGHHWAGRGRMILGLQGPRLSIWGQ